eukprot:scaffold169034_cov24-Tisochrysis_lutea.AAC.2
MGVNKLCLTEGEATVFMLVHHLSMCLVSEKSLMRGGKGAMPISQMHASRVTHAHALTSTRKESLKLLAHRPARESTPWCSSRLQALCHQLLLIQLKVMDRLEANAAGLGVGKNHCAKEEMRAIKHTSPGSTR